MKKLFKKISLWFKHGISGLKSILKKVVQPSIYVANLVNDIINNPVANIVVSLTPTKWDDDAIRYAKLVLPKVLLELNVLNDLQNKSDSEVITAIISEVRNYTKNDKAKFIEDLTLLLTKDLSDGKLTSDELLELIKFASNNKI